MADELPDAAYEASGPEQTLTAAGFDPDQAAALVEAMRQCCDEMIGGEEEPEPKPKGKGPVDLALVFAGPKKGKK